MKKILISVLTVAAVVACSKTDVQYEAAEEIQIVPVNRNVTKSVMAGTEFQGTEFNLWAWYQESPAAADMIGKWQEGFADGAATPTTLYIDEKPFEERDAAKNHWGGVVPYFWPKTGSLIFAAYHAPGLTAKDAVTYTFDGTDNYMTFKNVEQTKLADSGYAEDVMYANMTPSSYNSSNDVVSLQFRHALTWITVTVCKKSSPEIPATITVHDVYFTEVASKGEGVVTNQEEIKWTPDAETSKTWDVLNDGNVELKYNITGSVENNNRVVESVITTLDEYVIVPQDIKGTLKVRYTVESSDHSKFTETYTVDLTALKDGSHNAWLPGKHYTYNLQVGTDELLVSPVVTEWDPVNTSILIPLPETEPGEPGVDGGETGDGTDGN